MADKHNKQLEISRQSSIPYQLVHNNVCQQQEMISYQPICLV